MLFLRKLSRNVLIIVLALLSIGIIISGYLYYKNYEKTHRISVEQQLKAIADLKVGQIVQWRKERLGDASVYYKNASFSLMLKRFIDRPQDTDTRNSLVIWLSLVQSAYQYNRVFIVDTRGIERVSVPEIPEEPSIELFAKNTAEILSSGRISFTDFHRDTPDRPIHISVLAPIFYEPDNRFLGVLVLSIDPNKYLYPLIKRWPTPSKTAETLLIRREGNEVVFLNELRFKKNTALTLRSPLTNTDNPAVRAALGYEGIMEGKDYRGVPVIASIQRVPNSPWFFVARIDKSEVYAPVKERLWITIVLVTALLAGAGGVVGIFWRQQTTGFYRERLKTAEEIKESEARYRMLADHMNDTVWLMDLNLKTIYSSPSVEKLRGYTAAEIEKLPLKKHLTPQSYKKGMAVFQEEMARIKEDPSHSFVRTLELEFYRKDGSTFWSENKFSLIRDENGNPTSILGEGRDITERKLAEETLRESEGRVRAKLDAILSPEGDIGELELADIIDVPAIQKIMDDFYRLTHIGVAILDIKGKVLVGTGWQDICTKYHRINPETSRYCIESDTMLSKGVKNGTYKMYKCKNKVWDIATPITVGGKHLGNLFLGQFLFDDDSLDEEFFRAQARHYGFDEKEYISAYKSMPRWSRETVDAVMNFYMKFAEMFSKLSYSNIKLARTLTERDRFMISLQESEERYRSLVENAPDAIFINYEGKAGLVNKACLRLFGAEKPEEILGKSPFELFHPDYHETIRELVNLLQNQSEPILPIEEKIVRLDGGLVDVEVTAAHFSWGGVNSIHVILRDITERKRAEGELNRLYAELEQRVIDRTAQLEAANIELRAFSYSVSHDLRAPLRHMSGFVDLLEKRFSEQLPEKGRHYINNIADSTRQMGTLIDDLLEFSRAGQAEMLQEDIDMNIILKEALKELEQDTSKRKIEWIIPVLPSAYGDLSMLKLVWTNLLGNAIKFTRNRKKARIEVGAEEKNGETVYFIKDDGVGFDMKYIHKLFGVFQRLHSTEEFEGTGVGLANVRRIIARHGGRTWAEAKLDKGAAFYFSMPKRKETNGT